jgi:hypothetical protein
VGGEGFEHGLKQLLTAEFEHLNAQNLDRVLLIGTPDPASPLHISDDSGTVPALVNLQLFQAGFILAKEFRH